MQLNWNIFWKEKRNRLVLCVSIFLLIAVLIAFKSFLTFNEDRIGFIFNDPILRLYSPVDVSWITFTVTYLFCIVGIIIALNQPDLFVALLQAYTIMTLLRMCSLYLLPLQPPADIIPLRDVFLQSSFYSGRNNLKDLFFSGHTATIFLFAMGFTNKRLKWVFAAGALLVGVLVALQHAHYSIDVAAAPVFAYIALVIQKKINFQ